MKQIFTGVGVLTLVLVATVQAFGSNFKPIPDREAPIAYVGTQNANNVIQGTKLFYLKFPIELDFFIKDELREKPLSNVHVTVWDDTVGQVLDMLSDAPSLLALLPAGRYDVDTIGVDGRVITRSITVGPGHHQRAVFIWDAPDRNTRQSRN